MAVVQYSLSKFKLIGVVWLNVDGQLVPFTLDVMQARLDWRLNSIPNATVLLACGREATSGLPANIHYIVDALRMMLPFQLYMQAGEFSNSYGIPVEQWPAEPFLIFEGYVNSSGMYKTQGQISYSLNATHWLSDMNYSTCLSRTVHPINANALSNSAAIYGDFGLTPSFVAATSGDEFFTQETVATDFWGVALRPWLGQVTAQDILSDPDDPLLAEQAPEGNFNYEASRALSRFEPLDGAFYRYGVPLNLAEAQFESNLEVGQAIADDISMETFGNLASHTLWDRMVGTNSYAAGYLFCVVPMVQTALVVPFVPGIRGIWQTIYGEEYELISDDSRNERVMRAMRIYGGMGDQFGAFGLQQGEAAAQDTIGGAFTNPYLADGQIAYRAAPRWMSSIFNPDAYGQDAMQPSGFMANVLFPGAGPQLDKPRPTEVRQAARSLLNQFAEYAYVNEVVKGRSVTIQGRLRFDIGPGSSVEIKLTEEKFVDLILGDVGRNSVFGQVQGLTHLIDSQACQANTRIDVGWIRTPVENTLDGTSVDGSPLWSTNWYGCPNVEGFDPNPELPYILGWRQ